MTIRQITGNLFTIAVVGACAYGVLQWQGASSKGGEQARYAEKACVDEVGSRYNVTNVRPISLKESPDGFVVKASLLTARGAPAMAICLTSANGAVRDVSIDER